MDGDDDRFRLPPASSWGWRLTSRKFLMCVLALVITFGNYLLGHIDTIAMNVIVAFIAVGFGISEAIADAGRGVGGDAHARRH